MYFVYLMVSICGCNAYHLFQCGFFCIVFVCIVVCCGYEVGHEVTFLYLVCLFAFVMNHGCFSAHIVLLVGGCVVSIFFCACKCLLCVCCRRLP